MVTEPAPAATADPAQAAGVVPAEPMAARAGNVRRELHGDGRTAVAVKRYALADTAAFKCWGSGVRNEQLVAPLLGPLVPATQRIWSDTAAEYAELEWVDGRRPSTGLGAAELRQIGALLGRVHRCHGGWCGSLDGSRRFGSAVHAFADRFDSAVRLLGCADPELVDPTLADAVHRWSRPRLATLRLPGPPTLVHGDFGPANLLLGPHRSCLVDWEHSRWGHPQEDWTKIRLAAVFPEPNGFGSDQAVGQLAAGWQEVTGSPAPNDPAAELLLGLYYAICLGVFFGGQGRERLAWVRQVVS